MRTILIFLTIFNLNFDFAIQERLLHKMDPYALDYADDSGELLLHAKIMSLASLAFGFLVLLGIIVVMIRRNSTWGNNTIRLVGIVIIITSSLFLITGGYSAEQITPVIGLLGTIAGYLLGKSDDKKTQ